MCSWGAIYNNTSYALSLQTQAIAKLQEEATSGSRINRASDAPSDAYRVMHLRNQAADLDSYSSNLQEVVRNLGVTQQSLQDVSTSLTSAQALLTQAASGTYTADERAAIGEQIDSLLEQIVSSANTQSVGRYLFAGSNTSQPAYDVQRTNGKISSVTYQGSTKDLPVPVAPGIEYSGMANGDDVFRSHNRGAAELALSTTGASLGATTPSAQGDTWLTASHTSTSYAAASGVSAGATSAAGDSILGAHTITISAAGKTIRLDDGATVACSGTETNLKLQSSSGATVYVDMSAWTNQDGTFDATGNGTLSIDGGKTTTALTSSADLAVTDADGKILYVDTRNIASTGTDAVRIAGTSDVFSTLIHIRDLLTNPPAGMSTNDQTALLDKGLDSLKEVMGQVTRNTTIMGGRLQALDNLTTTLSNDKGTVSDQADSIQQADISQVAIDLTRNQNLYQMTLATASKLLSLSLMDYMSTSA